MKRTREPAAKAPGHKKKPTWKATSADARSIAERSAPDGYDITRQIGHLLRKAYQTHMAIFQSLSNNPQITPTQFAVMCVLKDSGPSSLTVIGRRIATDLATVRGIIERLHKRGMVSFSRDAADRRQVIARLEPEGATIVESMTPAAQQISEATVRNLTVAERVALQYLLEKISNTEVSATASDDEAVA
jgi:MarR family transcriptional regulator, lower aerobic nicotinate degradation pathway regulator